MTKKFIRHTSFPLTLLFALVLTACLGLRCRAAETAPAFPNAVQTQTEAPEGYTAITTAEELRAIADAPDGAYILMNDLDLSELSDWNSIPAFSGTLDGNGYAVKGLQVPLIVCMSGGSISNLALTDVSVNAEGVTGALVQTLGAEDCEGCSISNIYVTGTVSGADSVGGIIGSDSFGSNTLSDLANYASVHSAADLAGGITGTSSANAGSTYTACCNYGAVTGVRNGIGGIIGAAVCADRTTRFVSCTNTGEVSGANEIGGIAGYLICKSTDSAALLELTACANASLIKGTSKTGGIAGALYLEDDANHCDARIQVSECYHSGVIDCINSHSGGIAGNITLSGTASAASAVRIENCLNLGKLKDGGNIAGELALASGSVSIGKCIGIQPYNSAAKGILDRASVISQTTGGVCTLSDCYYFSATGEYAFTAGSAVSGTATALNATQIKTAASFRNFDFTNIWQIDAAKNNGYPYLKNLPLLPMPYTPLAPGTIVEDTATEATYKITSAGLEAAYLGTSNPSASVVTIPSEVELNGFVYRVTSIASRAFRGNQTLTKITIPDSVKVIDYGAFYGCTSLKTVSGCKGVTHIYKNVFWNCKKLVTVGSTANRITLPAIQLLGKRVFRNCISVKKVYLSSPDLVRIKSGAFRNCSSMTIFNAASQELARIEKYAFYHSKKLKAITLRTKKLTSGTVGNKAFTGIKATAAFKVPSAKISSYKDIFQSKGAGSKISVKSV